MRNLPYLPLVLVLVALVLTIIEGQKARWQSGLIFAVLLICVALALVGWPR